MPAAKLSGPMFERDSEVWKSEQHKDGAHYNIYSAFRSPHLTMDALRQLFPDGEANELNFCLFSTSGVHGHYGTIEDAEQRVLRGNKDEPDDVTFLVVQPRIVCTRYGNCQPRTPEDFEFLKKLRASSWRAVQSIGAHSA